MSFLGEIRRRKVFQVAAVYAVVAWLLVQIITSVEEPLSLPEWVDTLVIVLLAIGFPIALILSWAFDVTPDGIKAATRSERGTASAPALATTFSYVAQGLVLLAVGFLVVDQYVLEDGRNRADDALGGEVEPTLVNRFDYELPEGQVLRVQDRVLIAISPDGRHFVYNTTDGLYLRSMDELEARLIAGTAQRAGRPFFSPDGQSVAYFAFDGQIRRVSISGGAPVVIGDYFGNPIDPSWATGDMILFGAPEGIFRVSANGGTPDLIVEAQDNERLYGPELLADGDSLLFNVVTAGDWGAAQIVVKSLSTDERTVLIERGNDARYLSTGHLVYALEDGLYAVAFDAESLTVSGAATPLLQGVMRSFGTGGANYSVSNAGTLAYFVGGSTGGRGLAWVGRDGREEAISIGPSYYYYPRISPDAEGTRVVLDDRNETNDLWVFDFASETRTRLAIETGGSYPAWAPDSRYIAYHSGTSGIHWMAANNSGGPELLAGVTASPLFFSLSGTELVVSFQSADGDDDLGTIAVGTDTELVSLLSGPGQERNAERSPDGRWMAYQSNETGEWEIYVRPFPNVDDDQVPVSNAGGLMPLWSRNGRELFFLEPDSRNARLMSVAIDEARETTFSFGARARVFDYPYFIGAGGRPYDVSPDGQQFLVIKESGGAQGTTPQIIIVQNWFEELERLVPTQ